jgi:quinol monooxygenase YgiN
MVNLLIVHSVKDYKKWKPVFDENLPMRKAAGEQEARLFRNLDKPNEVIILQKWESVEKARKFIESPDLKKAMQKAGVEGKPEISFLEDISK